MTLTKGQPSRSNNVLVNASPSKLLDIAISNFEVHRSYDLEGTVQHFV